MVKSPLRVGELFAGVGGFRLGLEGPPSKKWETNLLKSTPADFKVIWSNQWEPRNEHQWASKIYVKRFGHANHFNEDINNFTRTTKDTIKIPELDVLVGGFPCQDYSVARTVSGELGIEGEKGKLWEPIWKIISRIHNKGTHKRPKIILLENVPRLLNSPANSRGLNFAIIIKRLLGLGYDVEWRVINASDYGMPQQRKRVFIMAYRTKGHGGNSKILGEATYGLKSSKNQLSLEKWMFGTSNEDVDDHEISPFGQAFPTNFHSYKRKNLVFDNFTNKSSDFGNAGYAWDGRHGSKRWVKQFCSWRTESIPINQKKIREIMVSKDHEEYDKSYEIDKSQLKKWEYEKGSKSEFRIRKSDLNNYPEISNLYDICKKSKSQKIWNQNKHEFQKILGNNGAYKYNEGAISFPDSIDKPSRTIVTSEIGKSASRMRHIIKQDYKTYRTLFPIETERLNMFPDNWTKIDNIPDSKRGFMMGNALVVGIIYKLRKPIKLLIKNRNN